MTSQQTEDSKHLLERLLEESEQASEPGDFLGQVVHSGDAELPTPMTAATLESAGYLKIWDTKTGEVSTTNLNMLETQLSKTRPDGSRVFTTVNPHIEPYRGTIKCLLHPDDPDRALWDSMGLSTCIKDNFPNEYEKSRHMSRRHRSEWASIEERQRRAERDSDRDYQRSVVDAIKTLVSQNNLSQEEVTKAVASVPKPQKARPDVTRVCAECGEVFTGKTVMVAQNKLKGHMTRNHKEVT